MVLHHPLLHQLCSSPKWLIALANLHFPFVDNFFLAASRMTRSLLRSNALNEKVSRFWLSCWLLINADLSVNEIVSEVSFFGQESHFSFRSYFKILLGVSPFSRRRKEFLIERPLKSSIHISFLVFWKCCSNCHAKEDSFLSLKHFFTIELSTQVYNFTRFHWFRKRTGGQAD